MGDEVARMVADKVANEVTDIVVDKVANIVLDMEMAVVTALVMEILIVEKEEAEVEQGLDMEYGQ